MSFEIGDMVYCEWTNKCNPECKPALCSIGTIMDGPVHDVVYWNGWLIPANYWVLDILSTEGHRIVAVEYRLQKIPPEDWEEIRQKEKEAVT